MRCQWRPVMELGSKHNRHLPGECRECWKPCFHKVEHGKHCPECLSLLAFHPNSVVRSALANENDLPDDILELLASDLQTSVSVPASQELNRRRGTDNGDITADLWDF